MHIPQGRKPEINVDAERQQKTTQLLFLNLLFSNKQVQQLLCKLKCKEPSDVTNKQENKGGAVKVEWKEAARLARLYSTDKLSCEVSSRVLASYQEAAEKRVEDWKM